MIYRQHFILCLLLQVGKTLGEKLLRQRNGNSNAKQDGFKKHQGNEFNFVVKENSNLPVEDEVEFWERTLQSSLDPTSAPSVSPLKCNLPSQVRRNMILSVLNTVSDPAALSTVGTPQNTAAEWLISEDEEVRCPDDNKLVQRYVMALFYFSTNGDDWTRCNQGDSTCGSVAPFLGQDNYLSGSHECNWAGLTCDAEQCITYIEFELNNVAGVLPFELEQLTNLEWLILEQGVLTGTIPSQIGNLDKLTRLDFDFNRLTGTIPEEIFGLTSLQILDFNNNQLSGTISTSIGNLSNLLFLQTHNNLFTGTIPAEIGNIFILLVGEFYGNDLTGTVPAEVCDLRPAPIGTGLLGVLSVDCSPNPSTGLVEVECSCCSGCNAEAATAL